MRNRNQVNDEIKTTLGLVPSFFEAVPDNQLDHEWQLFKSVQLDDGPIPQKYRELIGVAISGVTHCRYCAFFHTEAARLNGATDEEIEHALHFAKSSAGWSTYINGLQLDLDTFKNEVRTITNHVRAMQGGRTTTTSTGRPATERPRVS